MAVSSVCRKHLINGGMLAVPRRCSLSNIRSYRSTNLSATGKIPRTVLLPYNGLRSSLDVLYKSLPVVQVLIQEAHLATKVLLSKVQCSLVAVARTPSMRKLRDDGAYKKLETRCLRLLNRDAHARSLTHSACARIHFSSQLAESIKSESVRTAPENLKGQLIQFINANLLNPDVYERTWIKIQRRLPWLQRRIADKLQNIQNWVLSK